VRGGEKRNAEVAKVQRAQRRGWIGRKDRVEEGRGWIGRKDRVEEGRGEVREPSPRPSPRPPKGRGRKMKIMGEEKEKEEEEEERPPPSAARTPPPSGRGRRESRDCCVLRIGSDRIGILVVACGVKRRAGSPFYQKKRNCQRG